MRALALGGLMWGAISSAAAAQPQDVGPGPEAAERPALAVLNIEAGERPAVDGRLGEAVWARAPVATGFVQREPEPGAPATERTEVRVLHDGAALYVAFRCYTRDPATIVARMARRDQFVVSDRVSVDIDSYNDRRTAFTFAVTAAGVKQDILVYDDTAEDWNWDAVWDAAVARDEAGWTAEYRIPLSQLRFEAAEGPQRWGIQFQRTIPHTGEDAFWAPYLPDEDGYVSRFGVLEGLRGMRPARRVELLPYAATRLTRAPGDAADPFYRDNDVVTSVGADVKVGLASNLTLSATVNPDFGQVEADPAVVNLSAFETFFEERRPFFLEGTEIFGFGGTRTYRTRHNPTFFYSRRIGRPPQYYPGAAAYADVPDQTTIIGAAKVSGRVGNWSVGALDALTTEEHASYVGADGSGGRVPVEPLSNYFAGRVKRDFRAGQSVVGGLLTGVVRDLGDPAFEGFLHRSAVVGGADFVHTWANRRWAVSGVVAGSRVAGDPAAIGLTQRASRRYFQRPDADHLAFDPTRESLEGAFAEVSLAKTGGRHWSGSVTGTLVTPGFEVNDLGFQSRADSRSLSAQVNYQETAPGTDLLRSYRLYAFTIQSWNGGGERFDAFYALNGAAVFANLWSAGGRVFYQPETLNDRLTRGGPLARSPAMWNGYVEVYSDRRRPLHGDLYALGRRDASGRSERTLEVGLTWRPRPSLELRLAPAYSHFFDTDQYVGAVADSAAAATFGTRYVFADLERRVFALQTRLNWTFTPDLSLQLYVRPYLDVGRYERYKALRAARTFAFDEYAEGESPRTRSDFNVRALQGNAVLRWEYRPGSALFFVWQQAWDGYEPRGDFDLARDFGGIFDGDVRNVFLVKATYWLGL